MNTDNPRSTCRNCGRWLVGPLLLLIAVLPGSIPAFAADDAVTQNAGQTPASSAAEELLLFFEEEELYIATRRSTPVRKAPAIATVVNADQIRLMGARNLIDVLERIPGFGITRTYYSTYEIEIRGLKSTRNSKIKLMSDGHTLFIPPIGEAAWGFENLSLEYVDRIEVIRGPGSALYGANAFSGIINIVTKKGSDVDGTVATVGAGSFGTERISLMHGKKYGGLDVLASVTYLNTDGADEFVRSDAIGQSGRADDWAESWDATLRLDWNDFVLNTKYLQRRNGPFIGVTNVLTDESLLETEQYFADLSFKRQLNDQWTVKARAYYDYSRLEFNWELFPEGFAFAPLPQFTFADGVKGTPTGKGRTYGFELGADYKLAENNVITAGAVYEKVKQYDVEHHANFNPLTSENLGSFQDISSWGNWNIDTKRERTALYIQDEWKILNNASLTAGVRYDHYSDVGNATSPRIGLVWNVSDNAGIKMLYGEAFRVPNFEELHSINNPVAVGNPALDPEKIKTYEVALGFRPHQKAAVNVTFFYNKFTDRIELDQSLIIPRFRNAGEATIYGVESEIQYFIGKNRIYANHTWQRPEDDEQETRIPDVPSHRVNLGLDWKAGKYFSGNINVLYVGKRPRAENDPRDDLDAYETVNANVIIKNFFKTFEIRCSAYNLFDKTYAYPAPAGTLKDDYPAAGASYFIEVRYTF